MRSSRTTLLHASVYPLWERGRNKFAFRVHQVTSPGTNRTRISPPPRTNRTPISPLGLLKGDSSLPWAGARAGEGEGELRAGEEAGAFSVGDTVGRRVGSGYSRGSGVGKGTVGRAVGER